MRTPLYTQSYSGISFFRLVRTLSNVTHVPHYPASAPPCRMLVQQLLGLPPLPIGLHRPTLRSIVHHCFCCLELLEGTPRQQTGIHSEKKNCKYIRRFIIYRFIFFYNCYYYRAPDFNQYCVYEERVSQETPKISKRI